MKTKITIDNKKGNAKPKKEIPQNFSGFIYSAIADTTRVKQITLVMKTDKFFISDISLFNLFFAIGK